MVEVADATEARTLVAEAEALAEKLGRVRQSVGRVIFGQEQVVERTLITLLSGGHVLLVGVPGLGKTKLVETLGTVLGLDAILGLVRGARPEHSANPAVRKQLAWGPGPRAAQALMLATRARAVLDGRLAPSIEDVLALAEPVLRHRMALNFSARAEGVQVADVIETLKAQLG